MQREERLETSIEKANKVSDILEGSKEKQKSFRALTGTVDQVEVSPTVETDIGLLRRAAVNSSMDLSGKLTDEEMRSKMQQTAYDSVIQMEVSVIETETTETYAWFADDFPEDDLLAVAGVDEVEKLLYRNIPLIEVSNDVVPVFTAYDFSPSNTPVPKYVALGMQEAAKWSEDDTNEFITSATALPLTITSLLMLYSPLSLLFGIPTSLAYVGLIGVFMIAGFVMWMTGCYGALWPNDRRYARNLKPEFIRKIEQN